MGLEEKVIYQIYVKSFMDSNGDGLGDIKGITMKLDYLRKLGVDYLWLTPVFVSPMNDNGYDVADYYAVDPSFGTMEDLDELIAETKKRGMDIMLDMVFNHTSTSHEWFRKAMAGEETYRNYYIFRNGSGRRPPTNWISKFGGSAWEYVEASDDYYLHLFDRTQADLNWDNPEVRQELYKVVNFWLDKGVKGFRFDVVNLISKPAVFEDDLEGDGRRFYTDGERIHEYLKELNRNTFGKRENIITVGEMSSTNIDNCIRYSNPDEEELSMIFNFHHLKVDYDAGNKWTLKPFDFIALKTIFNDWQGAMEQHKGWMALFYNNHDQPRVVSRFGNDSVYRTKAAKMLATSIHLMRGTPYIYQGEEIGMTNASFSTIEEYRDVESINYHGILKAEGLGEEETLAILRERSRDNARTPMRWTNEKGFGFTEGEPWIPFGNGERINAEDDMNHGDSVNHHYRKLIDLRKNHPVIASGSFRMLDRDHEHVYAYIREHEGKRLLVVNNFYGDTLNYSLMEAMGPEGPAFDGSEDYTLLLSNYDDILMENRAITLRPYESLALYIE